MDLVLDLDGSLPLHRQLRDGLKEAILSGRLGPGQRLPSTRTLASRLSISRTTVCGVYETLESEGYLTGRHGSGTYVSAEMPEGAGAEGTGEPAEAFGSRTILSSRFRASMPGTSGFEREPAPRAGHAYDFHPGQGAWDQFPWESWRRLLARQWRSSWREAMDYGDPGGYAPLREEIARYLARSRAVACTPEQVVIVNGTQQALDLLSRITLDPGDGVAVEDPGYPAARQVFSSYEAKLVPIPVDQDGLEVDRLRGTGARLALVAPSHQFPTGSIMSLSRRLSLLRWAREEGCLVIEDDYDSEFRFEGRPLASLQGLDSAGTVAYLGSFSKALFPSLRVGYAVLPRDLIRPFESAKELTDRQTPILEQQLLTGFLREGHFERHLRRMRELYRGRRAALVESLGRYLAGTARVTGANSGMHLMARLPDGVDEKEVVRRASERGVGVYPARPCFTGADRYPALVFGYAGMTEESIQEGIRRLAGVIA